VNLLLLNFRCYCLDIGLDILKLNELTVSCLLMSSLIAAKKTGHMITATCEAECPPRQFVFLLSACQHNQRYPSHYELQYYTPPAYPQLTYLCTCYRNALLRITGLPSFSSLASISYALLVCPHSSGWPTSPTGCSSSLIHLADLPLILVARLPSFLSLAYFSYALLVCLHSPRWPPSRTCCSFVLIRRNGLLVRVARLPSFSLLANISYRFLVGSHPLRRPTAPTRRSFDLIFADLHSDIWQKHRVRHWWPTSSTSCSFVLIRCAGPLVRVARLPLFSLLANISYWLLIGPHSPRCPTSPTRCSFDLHFANLRSDVWV